MNKLSKEKIIEDAFLSIEKIGWKEFSLKKLASEKGYKVENVKSLIKNKTVLLVEFSKMIDSRTESNIDLEDLKESSVKDNLFELIMIRFDVMSPYKIGLKSISKELRNPVALKKISYNILNSMDFYLEFSNAYDNSPFDLLKKKLLILIYAYCFNVWLNDESSEQSKTMSELDRLLGIAEKFSQKSKSFFLF